MKLLLLPIATAFLAINLNAQVPCPPDVPCGGIPRFMEHGNVRWSDERGVLDHLADSFRNSSNHLIYFLIYAGQNSCRNEARLRALRAKNYLVQHHKIPQADILWKDGGFRPDLSVQIWLMPKDKPLPEPDTSITIDPSEVHLKRKCKNLLLPGVVAVSVKGIKYGDSGGHGVYNIQLKGPVELGK